MQQDPITKRIVFTDNVSWQHSTKNQIGMFVCGLGLILLGVFGLLIGVRDQYGQSSVLMTFFLIVVACLGAWIMLQLRTKFTLGTNGISLRRAFRTRYLEYDDIASFERTGEARQMKGKAISGELFVFKPKAIDRSSLSVWVLDQEPLSAEMEARLRRLPFSQRIS